MEEVMAGNIENVSIIVSKGSLEGVYPALILANGARAEGIDANLFFTFFGLDAVTKRRYQHLKVATVGILAYMSRHSSEDYPASPG
jgi:peroxiredoxin family protein